MSETLALASEQLNTLMSWSACFEEADAEKHGQQSLSPLVLTRVKVQGRELISVFLTYRLGLRVHREAGGDSGEASDLWPCGSPSCEVPLRLCTETVSWRAWQHPQTGRINRWPANLHLQTCSHRYTHIFSLADEKTQFNTFTGRFFISFFIHV